MAYLENREYPDKMPVTAVKFHNINFLAHWHTEIEFILVYEGSLGVGINSGYHVLEKGDMAMLAHGDIHYYDSRGRDSVVLIVDFRPEMISSLLDTEHADLSNIILNRSSLIHFDLDEASLARMRDCYDVIFEETAAKDAAYEPVVKGRLAELAGRFLRILPGSATIDNGLLGHGSKRILQKAMRYINDNYRQELTLDDLASHLNISPFYFSRLFSMTTGMTFKRYLNTLRIEKAHQLISTTTRPITEIAYDCGFGSIRTFNRVFLEIRGSKPSRLRQVADLASDR